jgi:hypothetical protein
MTATIARRLQALEAVQPRRMEHFVLSLPGESAADALRRCGFDPERLPGFMLVLPAKRAREEATDGEP